MSETTNKRPLSDSKTPSPCTKRPIKTARMDKETPDFQLDRGIDIDKPSQHPIENNSFERIFGMPETDLVQMSDESKKWQFVISTLQKAANKLAEVDALKEENMTLKQTLHSARGKINRLENDLEKTNSKLSDVECRMMQKDVVYYNVEETENENCIELANSILINDLKINPEDIHSQIDVAYRIGQKRKGPRPFVVKLTTQQAKDMATQNYRKNKNNTQIRMSDYFPAHIKEKRSAQLGDLKNLRTYYHGTGTKVNMVKDKIKVGGQTVDTIFSENILKSSPTASVPSISSISHTEIQSIQDSHFQGHATRIGSVKDAAAAREALFQSSHVASSHHIIYAYVVTDESGMKISGHSDDGEWSASKIITNIMRKEGENNIFVAVSRRHDGPNLGPKRFTAISLAAANAIKML